MVAHEIEASTSSLRTSLPCRSAILIAHWRVPLAVNDQVSSNSITATAATTAAMKIRVSGVDISNMMFTPRGQNLPLSAALLTKRRLAVFVGHLLPRFDGAGGKTMCACGKEEAVTVRSALAKAG